ncbi:MAG: lysylphosphatidylglycerol synthase transmembrane domain-containing protein [bacterium]|nr:lysylphosphatidylglycerol synthase transmembrane domain-containing protein [bacterium]
MKNEVDDKHRKRGNYIRAGIRIFVIITIAIFVLIFWKTLDAESWEQIKNVNYIFLFLAFLSSVLAWYFDGVIIWTFAKALGYKLPIMFCTGVNLANIFVSTVTPFQSGGAPLQIYMLNKKGISVGESITIGLIKWLLVMFLFAAISSTAFFSKESFLVDEKVFNIFKNVIFFVILIVVIFMLSGFFPHFYKVIIERIIRFFCRLRFLKRYEEPSIKTIAGLINEFHSSFISFTKGNFRYLLLSIFFTILFMIFYSLIAVFLIASIGKIDILDFSAVLHVIILQIFLVFVIYFSPTPGSSGTMELGFSLLFIKLTGESMIGFIVLFWRILTTFLPVIYGGAFILRFFSSKNFAGEIMDAIEIEKEKIKEYENKLQTKEIEKEEV